MLSGLYSFSGVPAQEHPLTPRLREFAGGGPWALGPLAIAGEGVISGSEADVVCHFDGRLYEQERLSAELGVPDQNPARLVATAFARWDNGAFSKLRGRYTAVVWDPRRQRALLVCDLLAASQMFMWRGMGCALFASELADLLALLPSSPGPDPDAFTAWLGGAFCPLGATLYEGVSRLGPGELWELTESSMQRVRHWFPEYVGTMKGTSGELAEGLREVLQRSVARRLSDSRTGVILSGGLDSSIVTALGARAAVPGSIGTYSSVFPGAEWDESVKVAQLTDHLGVPSATFEPEAQGAVWLALQHTRRWQLPLMGAGAVVEGLAVAEAARDGVDVVLDGQTGDEVLGFAPYVVADRLRQGRLLGALRLTGRWPLGRATTWREKRWILVNLGLKGLAPHRLADVARSRREIDEITPPWLLGAGKERFFELYDRWEWKLGSSGPLWWRQLSDTLVNAPHRELRIEYLRHRAGAHGLLNESPLYDPDVILYCLRLPPELAFDERFTRPLAREAMRELIPDEVRLQSQKAVFSSFCQDMITGADLPGIDALLTASDAQLGAYVDLEWLRSFWDSERPGAGKTSMFWGTVMWSLTAAEIWLRSRADDGFIDRMLARDDIRAPSARRTEPRLADPTFFPLVQAR